MKSEIIKQEPKSKCRLYTYPDCSDVYLVSPDEDYMATVIYSEREDSIGSMCDLSESSFGELIPFYGVIQITA